MDIKAEEKWQNCLKLINEKLPNQLFDLWFKPITFVSYNNDVLTLGVPNKHVPEFVEKNFLDVYKYALVSQFGNRFSLQYSIPQKPASTAPAEQPVADSPYKVNTPQQRDMPPIDPQLNRRYTFENFVQGESNKLSLSVAMSIAESPGRSAFNPFFLYGPSGVGKTHLVNAIGVRIRELYPEKRVLFVSAYVFKTQYTDSVRHNTRNDFINFYQTIDVLIIDDIQEITTENTQMAFFQIFNQLQHNNRQIIITCDRPPVLFEGIQERMLTRFKWGMVAEMEKPDAQLRRNILISKIRRDGLDIPADVLQYIAQNVESSVRELEGIINSIMAYSVVDNCEIDIHLAHRVVARAVNLEKKELTLDDINAAVCKRYGVKQKDLQSKSRKQAFVQARQIAMFLCHKYTDVTYTQIGRDFGKRDHSTVLHACNQVARRMGVDKDFRKDVEELESILK